jgi:hypothetical protein
MHFETQYSELTFKGLYGTLQHTMQNYIHVLTTCPEVPRDYLCQGYVYINFNSENQTKIKKKIEKILSKEEMFVVYFNNEYEKIFLSSKKDILLNFSFDYDSCRINVTFFSTQKTKVAKILRKIEKLNEEVLKPPPENFIFSFSQRVGFSATNCSVTKGYFVSISLE